MSELFESPGDYAIVTIDGRRCSRCGEVKPIEDFPIKDRERGLRRVWCRDCCRAYGREHYRKNKPTYLAKAERRRRTERPRVRALIDEYLRQHPCVECSCSDITVLEFDHRDPEQKDLAVGELARVAEWARVLREIQKCDVRCANCHRRKTSSQFGWARSVGVAIDPAVVRPGRSGRYALIESPQQSPLFSADPHGLRKCSRCGELKAVWQFPFRDIRTSTHAYYCRECQATYRRGHYERNKSDYMRRAITEAHLKKQDVLLVLHEYLREHPCVDCGESDLAVLEFDHVDKDGKIMAIGQMIGRRSWKAILAEIEKCVVRCANCHRKRTAAQQAWQCRLGERPGRYARMRSSSRVWRSGNAEHSQCSVADSISATRSVKPPR